MANYEYKEISVEQHKLADFRITEELRQFDVSVSGLDNNKSEYRARVYKRLCETLQKCLSMAGLERSASALFRGMIDIENKELPGK